MNALIQRSASAFAALPAPRRYLLLGGWVLVLTLLLVLIARPLLGVFHEWRQWQTLAQQAQAFKPAVAVSAEHWQALARARGVQLSAVEPRGDVWQLRGQVPNADALAQLLRAVQEQGARPLRWSLEQHRDGMQFNLDVSRAGSRP